MTGLRKNIQEINSKFVAKDFIGISTFFGTLSLSSGIASVGVSAIANRSIDALVLKYKLKNTKTDKEKEYMEKLNRFQKAGN
uniref:hypothetical protein n=1 Tax=Dialister sp. TaxID=1955814 RepID=UPI004027ABB8